MTIEEIRTKIALNRYHGINRDIQKQTGLSLPTIKKYMDGHIYHPTALKVLKTALKLVSNEVDSSNSR
jgi:hypothetical protein